MEEDEWDDALLSEIAALETRHLQMHSSHQPSVGPPSAACSSTAWSCQSCTLQNESARTSCLVCATPRYRKQQTSPRKTVQARLSFDGTSVPVTVAPLQQRQQNQDVGRSEPSPFAARELPVRSSTGSGLVLTSRRSGQAAATATLAAKRSTSTSPLQMQMPRHAAGEDSQAKKRYLDVMARSSFPQIDYEAALSFVYPTNYSVRDYQLTIAEKALYHNTLVSLPTGLGKTLVAAVVMYNFYRWFPTGKIVFMAPTKPLVAQQIKACHEIMGIPLSDTAELQGNVPPATRRVLWNSRRVFFCTPQSLQNDLRRGVCAAEKFVCIVVDEAHRATGNYAYCCVVQEIEAKTSFFRILALSATPGAKFDVIQEVVTNLRISHIESRSADDPDVKKYTHARQEEVIVCRLGAQILEVKAQFLKCLTPIVERLLRGNIIQQGDPEKLSGWYVLQAREKFRKSPSYASNRSAESDLALLVSLLHAKSLLTGHGLSSFREQITNWAEERKKGRMSWSKREMLQSVEFQALELSLAVIPDAKSSTNPASHPKLVKLREVLLEHFQRHAAGQSSTRAIVFTQYRASVSEIVALLRPLAPLLNVQPFIGQGASGKAKENKGQTQKVQQEIVRRFRLGEFNVLVATCIAEEGLDIGEVDLIVSFDALTSPVRMIQRMGRTGRKRVGRVVILVTEGDEQKKLTRSASAAKTVSRALTTFKSRFVYCKCPRMLPTGMCPQLKELEMKIPTFHASQVGGKTATTALDPDLWQLSDAERAVALMKYFPPNFASSSRNKLLPVVASRQHLLRRQPRGLVRKGVGTRVGYSARALALQGIVRKIHGLEEVLETDSDEEEDGKDGTGGSASAPQSGSAKEGNPSASPRLGPSGDSRRASVATNNAETDSEIGSPWRPTSSSSGGDDEGKCDDSFLANESVNTFDMHFSPQFVDSATQFAPETEETDRSKDSSKRHEEDPAPPPAAKRQKTGSDSPGPSANDGGQQADGVLGGQRTSSDSLDKEESQQMSATLSLTLTSESPRLPASSSKNVCQRAPVEVEASSTTESTHRRRSTRQLHFEEEEHPSEAEAESPQEKHETAVEEVAPPPESHEATQVIEEDRPASAFALLPPTTGETHAGGGTVDGSDDEEEAEEEPPAYSFALLPSLEGSSEAVPSKPSIPPKVADTPAQNGGSQPVEDGTDGDEVDEAHDVEPAMKDDLMDRPGTSAVIVDLTRQGRSHGVESHEERVEGVPLNPRTAGATQPVFQSQEKESRPEQEEEGCCSVCLESESFDDDPIVFCDGCNIAVHQFCYGLRAVPSDKWFCDVCAEARAGESVGTKPSQPRCQLCPVRGGAFKRTKCGQWVHVQCFLWIPEFRVEQGDDDALALGALSSLDPDRKTLDCSLCHSRKGYGIIQCAHKRCLCAFHVSCAASAHYRMDQLDPPDGQSSGSGTLFLAYCPLHRNSTAPVALPEQQKAPPSAKTRSPKLPPPTPVINASSPSHLLASPSSAEAKKRAKTFRRLKKKYDASQSQVLSQPGAKASPASTSPWQKRIRRPKRRRETCRVLAAAYIEDAADVRGARGDEDDEDDYGDDYRDAADDSFINDSSQLLYSQSAASPEDASKDSAKKTKKRKQSSPNMRAIYARSLFESQSSPLLLRRGGRQLGALPSNGIIQACLDELHHAPREAETPSPRPRTRARMPGIAEETPTSSAPMNASATVTESDGDESAAEAEPSPSFNLLGAGKRLESIQETAQRSAAEEEGGKAAAEVAPPSFTLLGASRPDVAPPTPAPLAAQDAGADELHKKIEANRLKALKKLQERRKANAQAQQPLLHPRTASSGANGFGFTSAAVLMSKEPREDEVAAPPVGAQPRAAPRSPPRGATASAVDLTSPTPGKPAQDRPPKWVLFASPSFASSSAFPAFLSAKHADSAVVVEDSLEADALLSVRTAVLFLTGQQLHELALASPAQNVVKSRRIGTLLAMHKRLVVAVLHGGSDPPEGLRLSQLPNVTVLLQPRVEALCAQLHQLARQERAEGFELPAPSLCRPDFSGGVVRALDADFASRLAFFRAIPSLSLGSALSLSFRFKNFAAGQVPVRKFNEMHWRRMLPWISESTAEETRRFVHQGMQAH